MDLTLRGVSIGPLEIRFYSLMIMLGLFSGMLLAQWIARKFQEDHSHVMNIAVVGTVCALVGARLYHVFDQQEWPYYSANPAQIVAIWNGGIGIFGAIAGAIFGLFLYARFKRIETLRWLDIGAPALLLGQAIGRWGNYFNQELYGGPSNLAFPFSISIPAWRVAAETPQFLGSTRFHPLFLYESVLSAIGVMVLVYVMFRFRHRLRPGDMILAYLAWYSVERFGLEFLRVGNWTQGGLPMAQILSTILFLGAIAVVFARHFLWSPPPFAGARTTRASRNTLRRSIRRGSRGGR
jgi:phosphatidylglycerol:prolipoprotein diacylglycerol transferase